MLIELLLFLIGLILLVFGSDIFVKRAAKIAQHLGLSPFIIGLTLVAVGTSLPELGAAIAAALRQESGLVIGNIIGSNIANIALIIGITSIIATVKTTKTILRREAYIMLYITMLIALFFVTGTITRVEGIILLLLFFAYNVFIIHVKDEPRQGLHAFISSFLRLEYVGMLQKDMGSHVQKAKHAIKNTPFVKDFLIAVVSMAAIILGADMFVDGAIYIANSFGISSIVIGATLVAIGTSLPELAVSISAVTKGLGGIAIGNILGSNIANLLLILGLTALLQPIFIPKFALWYLMPVLLAFSLLLVIFLRSGYRIVRKEGVFFLVGYGIYLFFLFNFG
ncbi:MAG: calcium/sodium antiporter [Nanoarchaeota archaeon]